jgi:hypothetical protein
VKTNRRFHVAAVQIACGALGSDRVRQIADEEAARSPEYLKPPEGFSEWHTGGGCMSYVREVGSCEVLLTDNDGTYFPTESDWMVGSYDEEHQQIAIRCVGEMSLADAIAAAIEEAKTADTMQSARRRGEDVS